MRIRAILVDDEPWSMKQFLIECQDMGIELQECFTDAETALSYAGEHTVELAFLDVKLPDMDGIALGRKLKQMNHDMLIIYISAYEEYIKEAIVDIKADYYILKPYSAADVADALERVRYLSGRLHKRVMVRTFGEFDVFIDGELVAFSNQKAKELFALCIDNGGEVSMKKAVEMLWENRNYDERVKGLYRKAILYLRMMFKEYGVENIFGSARGSCHINKREIDCDYYEVLDGKCIKDTLFDGRYMPNYSWGEETCGHLCRIAAEYLLD
ncbi:MAG: response regulator [Bacillus sp. (in: Bacteria)]|nr:response regulator [Bacillus sp. (in: firmicutes)]MCM1426677.1 response regulator [Eubacterium sp.]